jgi:hypothetical protein
MLAKAKNTSGTYKKKAVKFYFKLAGVLFVKQAFGPNKLRTPAKC